jgi:hypothetical protein
MIHSIEVISMISCTEKVVWIIALIVLLVAFYFGDVRTAGMLITVAAAVWYGVICPFADEARGLNLKSKGSVN